MSNGKKKGKGNAKAGNKYLSWAYSEAAHFAIRFQPEAKRFFEHKKSIWELGWPNEVSQTVELEKQIMA